MKRLLIIFVIIFLLAALVFGVSARTRNTDKNAVPVNSKTFFSATNPEGASFSMADYHGRPVILNFWATWCPPCVMEVPHLIDIQEKYKKDGLVVIGVSLDDSVPPVNAFIDRLGVTYPVVMGTEAIVKQYGNFSSIPTTFFLDREHNIIRTVSGYHDKAFFDHMARELLR